MADSKYKDVNVREDWPSVIYYMEPPPGTGLYQWAIRGSCDRVEDVPEGAEIQRIGGHGTDCRCYSCGKPTSNYCHDNLGDNWVHALSTCVECFEKNGRYNGSRVSVKMVPGILFENTVKAQFLGRDYEFCVLDASSAIEVPVDVLFSECGGVRIVMGGDELTISDLKGELDEPCKRNGAV
eukprot:GHVR01094218.1.p2 GENE.GHVR01094218.1~~GHVR01094218.1.p2  ORF type:complete len:181 (+),score=16.12 GHVR01094218.1:1032-1574(+)